MNNGNSEVIRVKTDCLFFNNIGNLCTRVEGMARCDECSECEFKYIDELKEENEQMRAKLGKIKELAIPLSCNNPLDCWMNQDDGTGDIYGCDGYDYKGCPSGFASCVLKIIEGAEEGVQI